MLTANDLLIRIRGERSGATRAIQGTEAQLAAFSATAAGATATTGRLRTGVVGLDIASKGATGTTAGLRASIVGYNAAAARAGVVTTGLGQAAKGVAATNAAVATTAEGAAGSMAAYNAVMLRTARTTGIYDATTKKATASTAAMGMANTRAAAQTRAFATSTAQATGATTGLISSTGALTAALIGPAALIWAFASANRQATEFEKSLKRVEVLVGVNRDLVQKWSSDLLEMAPRLGRGPNELAEALFVVTSAGQRGAAALDIVTMAAKASAVGLGETKEVARAVTAAMQAYSKYGMDAAKATDILVTTVREGNLEAEALAGSLGRVLGIAAEAGVTFEEVGAFIATFTRVGVSAEEAVTALRGTINLILKPSKQAKDALAGFGLTIQDVRRAVGEQGLARTLVQLVNILREDDEALTQVIPNVRALAGILATAGAQSEDFLKIADNFEVALSNTGVAFEDTSNTAAHSLDRIKASAEVLKIELGQGLLPAMADVSDAMTGSITGMRVFMHGLGLIGVGVASFVRVIINSADTLVTTLTALGANIGFHLGTILNKILLEPIAWVIDKLGLPIQTFVVDTEYLQALSTVAWESIRKNVNDVDDAIQDVIDQAARFALAMEGYDPALVTMSKFADEAGRAADEIERGNRGAGLVAKKPVTFEFTPEMRQSWPNMALGAVKNWLEDVKRLDPTKEVEAMRLALQIVDETTAQTYRYNTAMIGLNAALASGDITAEQYEQGVEAIGQAMEETRFAFETLAPAAANVVASMIRALRGEGGGVMGAIGGILGTAGLFASAVPGGQGLGAGLTAASIVAGAFTGGRPTPVRVEEYSERAKAEMRESYGGPSVVNLTLIEAVTRRVISQVEYQLRRGERLDARSRIPAGTTLADLESG